jgi:serine/threonine protein kinase/tetratricopeptide (TPR) repeat protein
VTFDPKRAQAIFLQAVELASTTARADLLAHECGEDRELLRRVEALLLAHDAPDSVLDVPFVGPPPPAAPALAPAGPTLSHVQNGNAQDACETTADDPTPGALASIERPGRRIGPYTLTQVIGEGGMGVVYDAEQVAPVRRRVALKVIKPGMDTDAILARFDAERQALALMDHPNIARVFDAGTTDSGRPYFVMERVESIPIAGYCDDARLAPRQRLELFIPVCQAIQHADLKGIIHRDVKPSNVLVTTVDGQPVPKVIDFGVAKAIDQRQADRTLFTRLGAIVGTPEYMSPEQAGASPDIDTRTDIYSLGVLLYELLTGTTPLDREMLRWAAFDEVLRRVREEEPPKPSTRLSGTDDRIPSVAAQRATEPARLAKLVRGDLDWIVMKALDKDRTRRYETASGLARDIQRHLDGDLVEAGPPSAAYRLRKFARKHRAALLTTVSFAAMLLAMSAVSTWQAIRATKAEAWALGEAARASKAQTKAYAEAEKARLSAAESEAVRNFLENDLLAATRPEGEKGGLSRSATIRQAVDAARSRIGDVFKDQPLVEAAVRSTLGTTYFYLSEFTAAIQELERAVELRRSRLGPEDPQTLESRNTLALAYEKAGRTAPAIAILELDVKLQEARLGPDHPDTLTWRNNLAWVYVCDGRIAQATAIYEEVVKRRDSKLGPDHPDTLLSRDSLARVLQTAGRVDESIPIAEAVVTQGESKLGPDHPATLRFRKNLATAYLAAGRTTEAIALHEANVKRLQSKFGPEHLDTFIGEYGLGRAYRIAGRAAEAIKWLGENLKSMQSKLGPGHYATLATCDQLAQAYLDAGRTPEALELLEGTLRRMESSLSPSSHLTLGCRNTLAGAYIVAGRIGDAIVILEANLRLAESTLGSENPDTVTYRHHFAVCLLQADRTTEAIEILEATLKFEESKFGTHYLGTLRTRNSLAAAYADAGRVTEAITLQETTQKSNEVDLGTDHPETLLSRFNLAEFYGEVGRTALAIATHEANLKLMQSKLGPDHPHTLRGRRGRADAYLAAGRIGEAIAMHEATLKLMESKLGPDHPHTLGCRNSLARAYQAAGRLTDALPLFESTVKISNAKRGPDHSFTLLAMNNLAGAYLEVRRWAEAETLLSDCLGLREKKKPEDWRKYHTLSQRGASLLGQKKHAEAEPLLLEGYQGLKARENLIPFLDNKKLTEATARIVTLYESWGKADKAAEWRKKVEMSTEKKTGTAGAR